MKEYANEFTAKFLSRWKKPTDYSEENLREFLRDMFIAFAETMEISDLKVKSITASSGDIEELGFKKFKPGAGVPGVGG